MSTNGVITFKTAKGSGNITRIAMGCDGHAAVKKILMALASGELNAENCVDYVREQKFELPENLRIDKIATRQKFSNPRWQFTAPDTITINFPYQIIELSKGSDFYGEIADDNQDALAIQAKLLMKNWRIIALPIPKTNKAAERKICQDPMLLHWNRTLKSHI